MKIYVKLLGQLCNQMFIIASGYALSKKFNKDLIIFYNPYDHNENKYISYFKNFTFEPVKNVMCEKFTDTRGGIENLFTYLDVTLEPEKEYSFHCYFQNERYFEDYYNELYDLFIESKILSIISNIYTKVNNSYFIHYRRTDYIGHGGLNIQLNNYFPHAIKYVLSRDPSAHFYICSDDIPFCKNYQPFKEIDCTFIENLDPINTLHLMTMCAKGAIGSNSSFSWWGSYLNKNPDKMVLFPKKWINGWDVNIGFKGSILIDF
jgi:hypothetical protein